SRLQVWLSRPAAEAVIHIAGFVNRPTQGGRFDVPPIRPRGTLTGTVRASARDEVALVPIQTVNLSEAAPDDPGSREWRYTIDGPQPYRMAFDVQRAAGTVVAPPPVESGRNTHQPRMLGTRP